MRIGLSFSRCVRDMVDGKVDINDVLVIVARTKFNPTNDDDWKSIWDGYCHGRTGCWADYPDQEQKFRDVTLDLWRRGLLHQPRVFGAWPLSRSECWLEAVLPSEELDANPFAKEAWDSFQVAASLANVTLRRDIG